MSNRTGNPDILKNSLNDALVATLFWAINLIWTIGYCWYCGYKSPPVGLAPVELPTTFGIPNWVFWGIFIPWFLCTLFTIVYALFLMRDDPMEASKEEGTANHGT